MIEAPAIFLFGFVVGAYALYVCQQLVKVITKCS
jgi:hypothetical protein